MLRRVVVILLFFLPLRLWSQTVYQDSLYDLLLGKIPDTTRADVLNLIAESFLDENDYVAIREARHAYDFGVRAKDLSRQAASLYFIGMGYTNVNRFSDAQEYYFRSLKLSEEDDNEQLLLRNYNQIGIIFSYNKNHRQAFKYFQLFLDKSIETGNKGYIARGYNNLGISLKNQGKFEEAIDYYKKALEIFREKQFNQGIISCYANIGVSLVELGNFDSGLVYHEKAYELAKAENDTFSLAIAFINLGELHFYKKEYALAASFYQKAIKVSEKKGLLQQLCEAVEGMYRCYEVNGDYKNAFLFHKEYLHLRDSIFNDETNAKLSLAESNYNQLKLEQEMEKKEQQNKLEKAVNEKKLAQEKAQNEETKKYVWVLIVVSLSIIILVVVVYIRYKEKNKANILLQKQKNEIEESKKEITDSINYALRIQKAVLPDEKALNNYFSDHFIFYQPKDIVSGDFYWFAAAGEKLVVAAADCTGHGVPGGFMSMIGTDKLNHAVFEKKETRPDKILSLLNEGIKTALKQDDSADSSRDGMDISLCVFDFKQKKLQWSGANRPLWIIRNNQLSETKPVKNGLGGFSLQNAIYEMHEIPLQSGDMIYLFSDGFADQFGGPESKKITTKRFKELLVSLSHENMTRQKEQLGDFFRKWAGNNDQIDDVMIIGLKV